MARRLDASFFFAVCLLASLAAVGLAFVLGAWAYGLSPLGPGLAVLGALFAGAAFLFVEDRPLSQAEALLWARLLGGVLLLGLGESLLYPDSDSKDLWSGLGFSGLVAGAALLWPPGAWKSRAVALAGAVVLAVLGIVVGHAGGHLAFDLFVGPCHGQATSLLFWIVLGLALAALGLGAASAPQPSLAPEAPLSRRSEYGLLALVLAVAGALRFYRPGALPPGYWFDEINLARVTRALMDHVGAPPIYVLDQVENPGAYLWLGAALFKIFSVQVPVLRIAAGAFGLLALLPFWGLARLWLGRRWALAATLSFGVMHWVLIPQRIAFMSGFALFWMLASFWGLWSAQLRGGWKRWLLAGLLLGTNFHTYTPARLVPVVVLAFLALQAGLDSNWRRTRAEWWAFGAGFLLLSAPMLVWVAAHRGAYLHRAQEVSLFADVAKNQRPLLPELWGTFAKHVLMFQFRGDFNARHNIHFYPHADFILACALALGFPWTLGRALSDARARFLWLWLGLMLAAGIFSLPVEAPQGHRTILAAPVLPLAAAFALREILGRFRAALGSGWPLGAKAVGLVLLASLVFLNAWNGLEVWLPSEATFRSFSPRSSAVAELVAASPVGAAVYLSSLPKEYEFNGYEMGVFADFVLQRQGRSLHPLGSSQAVEPMQSVLHTFGRGWLDGGISGTDPSQDGLTPTTQVLLVWGESDTDISQQVHLEFPDLVPDKAVQPFPGSGEPSCLYESLVIPLQRIPSMGPSRTKPLFYRLPQEHGS